MAEGESAQYAIMAKGVPFMQALIANLVKQSECNFDASITATDILEAKNTVGIDIGEGTVNYPVFTNGKFNPDASDTFDTGYGSVLNTALDRLTESGYPFKNRKQLADFLQTPPTNLSRVKYNKVKAIVDEETISFAKEVSIHLVKTLAKSGAYTEVIYVYGGGATPIRSLLYPALVDAVNSFGDPYPILYLDSTYSRWLNREGLYHVADVIDKRSELQ